MGEQRVDALSLVRGEAQMRHRPAVEPPLRRPVRKPVDLQPQARGAGRETRQTQESAEADGDLPVVRVRPRQPSVEIAEDQRLVPPPERDLPRLPVVRIGRKNRMAKHLQPGVLRLWPVEPPGGARLLGRLHHAPESAGQRQG
jgi:hypothetical protein